MDSNVADHYGVLGVDPTASAAELKAAYLHLIREFTPENEPERFRLVSEAYRTLSNPKKRAAYDREERLPAEVQEGMQAAMSRAEDGDLAGGIAQLQELHRRFGDFRELVFSLGVLYDRAERHGEAEAAFSSLTESDHADSRALTWLGDSQRKQGNHAAARRTLREAIVLDKGWTDAYLCLSRSFAETGDHGRAVDVLDRGIAADGVSDAQDLPLIVEKILIHAARDEWERLEAAAAELVEAVPDSDREARTYAASRIWPLGKAFLEAGRVDLAHYVLRTVGKLDPDNEGARSASAELEKLAAAQRERRALYEDESVPAWIKGLLALWSGDEKADDPEDFIRNVMIMVASNLEANKRAFDLARRRYPAAVGQHAGIWNELVQLVEKRPTPAGASSGCLILIALGLAVSTAIGVAS